MPKFQTAAGGGGEVLSDAQIQALLVREPFQLRLEEIEQLTDWELINIYFRAGDPEQLKKGVYWPAPDRPGDGEEGEEIREIVPFEEMYRQRLRARKFLSEEYIESRWRAFLRDNPRLRVQVDG